MVIFIMVIIVIMVISIWAIKFTRLVFIITIHKYIIFAHKYTFTNINIRNFQDTRGKHRG